MSYSNPLSAHGPRGSKDTHSLSSLRQNGKDRREREIEAPLVFAVQVCSGRARSEPTLREAGGGQRVSAESRWIISPAWSPCQRRGTAHFAEFLHQSQ